MLLKSLISTVGVFATSASATIYYAGVSESGGEFGVYSGTGTVGTGLPGVFGRDYDFINKSAVDVYVDQNKANLFRVTFLLERMCPPATGLGSKFNETHYSYYADAINYITQTKSSYAILDPHNYMRYNDPSSQPYSGSIIGDTTDAKAATTAQFGAFWGELAKRFKNNQNVIFALMNEPHDMATSLVVKNNQAAITAIRKAGAKNLILAPGNSWTGGHAWTQGSDPSSALLQTLQDPLNNTAIDIHEYLDSDFSGSHSVCSSPASTNLAALTSWLQTYKLKAMITEFGSANGTECEPYISGMINYMAANDVYIGWTAWAAGPFWGANSPCCADSAQWGSLEPGSLAGDGSPGLYETVWLKTIQPLLPKTLQRSGPATVHH
ncbi:e9d73e45-624a-4300-ab63-8589dcdfc5d5 [Sclerotinia trifoliorum]|uniref:Endoglucanase EG-II n=1 Tax=Sclerotinia trifoliorum TaxID=28548 RepID=A0A8H2VV01_9HELO|nr:e9d73e45-624a-4300-ab63-8589dcdfc5d5 [Sclerotinia trifoliorum]